MESTKTHEAPTTPTSQMIEQFTDEELISEYLATLGLQEVSQEYLACLEDEHFKRNLGRVALRWLIENNVGVEE